MEEEAVFEDIERHIKKELRAAQEEIKICVAWINIKNYRKVLQEAASRGVSVEIIYNSDHRNSKNADYSTPDISLYPIKTKSANIYMHNKFCIIDSKTIISGSFNWSSHAKNHYENILILRNKFKLVKKFLHEFEELKTHHNTYYLQKITYCEYPLSSEGSRACRSSAFHIGIIGDEEGLYRDSEIEIWKICHTQRHVQLISKNEEQFFRAKQGLENDFHLDDDPGSDERSLMIEEFQRELYNDKKLQNYFNNRTGDRVHAIGRVGLLNEIGHLKFNEHPEYGIIIIWKDIIYRKQIPDLYYEEEGGVSEIINSHI
ncbi:MAG: phospholipase D-like domain-containing protein [Pseudomonadota bacterium]